MNPQTPPADLRLTLTSLQGTRLLAGILAEAVRRENPGVLLLYGDLGAGKTTFTAALVKALPGGSEAETSSPSFTLCNIYCTEPTVHHFDLYRLEPGLPDESLEESLDDSSVLTIVEWPERLSPAGLPADGLIVRFFRGASEEERPVELSVLGPVGGRCLSLVAKALEGSFTL